MEASTLPFSLSLVSVPESWSRHTLRHSPLFFSSSFFIFQGFGAGRMALGKAFGRARASLHLRRWLRQGHSRGGTIFFLGFSSPLTSVPTGWAPALASAQLPATLLSCFLASCCGSFLCSTSSPLQASINHQKGDQIPTSSHNTLCRFRFGKHNDNPTKVMQI